MIDGDDGLSGIGVDKLIAGFDILILHEGIAQNRLPKVDDSQKWKKVGIDFSKILVPVDDRKF